MSIGAPLPRPTTPDGTPPEDGAFDGLCEAAVRERVARQASSGALLETGELDPVRMCRYAAGALQGMERAEAERMLARSRWAVGRVAALVRGARQEGSLAARVLSSARAGAEPLEPARVVGAALLASLEGGAQAPAGPAQAASLLSQGQLEEARQTLSALPPSGDPLLELARRISQPDPDPLQPWVALLEAV